MKKLLLIIAISFAIKGYSQKNDKLQKQPIEDSAYTKVDELPKFTGGNEAMYQFIQTGVQYPQAEKEAKIQGTSYVGFIVEKDGTISNIRVIKGVNKGPGCDAESIRVISSMPKWIPGKKDGKIVRTNFILPIKFTILK